MFLVLPPGVERILVGALASLAVPPSLSIEHAHTGLGGSVLDALGQRLVWSIQEIHYTGRGSAGVACLGTGGAEAAADDTGAPSSSKS